MAISKDRISELLNRLSDNDLELVAELMERLVTSDNVTRIIPLDDEPTTKEDIDSINKANEAYLNGELISFKDVEHELRN